MAYTVWVHTASLGSSFSYHVYVVCEEREPLSLSGRRVRVSISRCIGGAGQQVVSLESAKYN